MMINKVKHTAPEPYLTDKRLEYRKRRNRADYFIRRPCVRAIVFTRDNRQCVDCGSPDDLTVDHIISVYRGGPNDLDNLQTLCRKCNAGKLP